MTSPRIVSAKNLCHINFGWSQLFLAQLSFNFSHWEQSYLVLSKIPFTQISRLGSKLLAYKQLIQFLFMGLLGEPIMGQSEQISKAKMFKICFYSFETSNEVSARPEVHQPPHDRKVPRLILASKNRKKT